MTSCRKDISADATQLSKSRSTDVGAPVRYEPQTTAEVMRMRSGKPPIPKSAGDWIEGHHRQQIPMSKGGVIDDYGGGGEPIVQTAIILDTTFLHNLLISNVRKSFVNSINPGGAEYMTGDGEGI